MFTMVTADARIVLPCQPFHTFDVYENTHWLNRLDPVT